MVAAVEELMNKGEDRLSPLLPIFATRGRGLERQAFHK
jgi:hypothetical protein